MILSNQSFNWLDLIPNQWEIDKVKDHFYFSNIQTENFDNYPVLSLTMSGVKKRNMDSNEGQLPESYEKYNLVDPSCLVFNPMDLISGWVDVPKTEGLISPSYRTIKLRSDETNLHFIKYYFQSLYKEKVLFYFGEGVHYDYRWGLGKETLKNFPIPIPPKEEQNKIVGFLDKKTTQIDKLTKKIERKIELLKEQRTSLINEVVTKGLNPDVEMKDSGIEWIGEIPSDWLLGKLYQFSQLKSGSTPLRDKPEFWENGTIPWMSSGEINKRIIKSIDSKISELGHQNSNTPMLPVGTVMMGLNGQGKTKGTVGILETETTCNQSLCGMIFKDGQNSKYYYYYLDSKYLVLRGLVGEGKREGLSVSFLKSFQILVPPKLEQDKIVEYLDDQTQKIDEIILNEEKRIKLLIEYKKSLISEVVIGKKRVV